MSLHTMCSKRSADCFEIDVYPNRPLFQSSNNAIVSSTFKRLPQSESWDFKLSLAIEIMPWKWTVIKITVCNLKIRFHPTHYKPYALTPLGKAKVSTQRMDYFIDRFKNSGFRAARAGIIFSGDHGTFTG